MPELNSAAAALFKGFQNECQRLLRSLKRDFQPGGKQRLELRRQGAEVDAVFFRCDKQPGAGVLFELEEQIDIGLRITMMVAEGALGGDRLSQFPECIKKLPWPRNGAKSHYLAGGPLQGNDAAGLEYPRPQ